MLRVESGADRHYVLAVIEDQAMPKDTSVTLPDHFATFIEDRIAHGRYGSASDVVQAGLRLLEEYEMKVIEGEQSGAAGPFDVEAFIERKRNESRTR
jgi:antitoxin ParD1/3/4